MGGLDLYVRISQNVVFKQYMGTLEECVRNAKPQVTHTNTQNQEVQVGSFLLLCLPGDFDNGLCFQKLL